MITAHGTVDSGRTVLMRALGAGWGCQTLRAQRPMEESHATDKDTSQHGCPRVARCGENLPQTSVGVGPIRPKQERSGWRRTDNEIWVTHISECGRYVSMKTTLDIQDELFVRAKRLAKRTGRPLRSLVEEGLRHVLARERTGPYKLQDCSVGDPRGPNPLEVLSWNELRDEIYGTGAAR